MEAFVSTEYRETFIDIYASDPEKRLVTCIELLSPSNKRRGSEGWELYLRKRQGLLLGAGATSSNWTCCAVDGVLPMVTPWPAQPLCVTGVSQQTRSAAKFGPLSSSVPCRAIPMPLSPPDADV